MFLKRYKVKCTQQRFSKDVQVSFDLLAWSEKSARRKAERKFNPRWYIEVEAL